MCVCVCIYQKRNKIIGLCVNNRNTAFLIVGSDNTYIIENYLKE